MKRILITGGAGFVGSSLALFLQQQYDGIEIICLDNLYRKGSELNKERIESVGITFIKGDVRNRKDFDIAPCDLLIDAAAEPSVMAGSAGDADYVVDTNLGGTINLLETARRWNAGVIFLSTSRVYPVELLQEIRLDECDKRFEIAEKQLLSGISQRGISENFPLDILNAGDYEAERAGRTFYGATKYASEIMVREYAEHFGLRTVINRCGVLAGPWQMGKVDQGVTALWVAAHIYGKKLSYIGYKGKQVRDVLHVSDLAELIVRQIADIDNWHGDVYNVGGGREISFSLRELTDIVSTVTGQKIDIAIVNENRAGDIPLYITDITKARHKYNWQPAKKVNDIINDMARWLLDNKSVLETVFDFISI